MFIISCEVENPVSNDNKPITFNGIYMDSVLFTSSRAIGTSYIPSVHIMNFDGSGIRAVTTKWFTFGGCWTSDKREIMFVADTSFSDFKRILNIMNADGSNKKTLSNDYEDVWVFRPSPDKSKIVYLTLGKGNAKDTLKIMNFDGSNKKVLLKDVGDVQHITWASDSKSVAFGANIDGWNRIYSISINGGTISNLFPRINDSYPEWSRDGSKIVFQRGGSLMIFNNITKELKEIKTGIIVRQPSFSFDGNQIMFCGRENWNHSSHIFLINTDGTGFRKVTDDFGEDSTPSWN